MEVSASKAFQIITKESGLFAQSLSKWHLTAQIGSFQVSSHIRKRQTGLSEVLCSLLPPGSGEKTAGICPEPALHVTIEAASSHTANVFLSWKSRRKSPKLHRPQTYPFFYWPTMSASQLCWKKQSLKQRLRQHRTGFPQILRSLSTLPLTEFFMEIIVHQEFDLNESCKALFPIFWTTQYKRCLSPSSSQPSSPHGKLVYWKWEEFWVYSMPWDHAYHSCSIIIEPKTNVKTQTLR